jgi:hypothetical protein
MTDQQEQIRTIYRILYQIVKAAITTYPDDEGIKRLIVSIGETARVTCPKAEAAFAALIEKKQIEQTQPTKATSQNEHAPNG